MKMSIHLVRNSVLIIAAMVFLLTNCGKDDEDNPAIVRDIDGNEYHTITLGTQVWLLENLRTTRYRNGDTIPVVEDFQDWHDQTTGGMCYYNNDTTFAARYGALYNFYAVEDPRQIAPTGWHVPTSKEFAILRSYASSNAGTSGTQSKALASNTLWHYTSDPGTPGNEVTLNNYTGFSAQPGGLREISDQCPFKSFFEACYFYTTTTGYDHYYQYYIFFLLDGSQSEAGIYLHYLGNGYYTGNSRNFGMSVRCIKDE